MPWHDTSQGARARLALLPTNPFFREDVDLVREVFGLRPDMFDSPETDPEVKALEQLQQEGVPVINVEATARNRRAERWLHVHRRTVEGRPAYQGPNVDFKGDPLSSEERERQQGRLRGLLSTEANSSAEESAQLDLSAPHFPDWLKSRPGGPDPYRSTKVPLERVAARLVERHRLPWFMVRRIEMFILALDNSFLENTIFARAFLDDAADHWHKGYSVTVSGLDEYVTRKDWNRIWDIAVVPRQQLSWTLRGMSPHGQRAPSIDALRKVLPVYWLVKRRLSVEEALSKLSEAGEETMDESTARRGINELRPLLKLQR